MRHERLPVLKGEVLRCFRSGCACAFFWGPGEMFKFFGEMIRSGNVLPS